MSFERDALRYCEETLGPGIGLKNPRPVSQNARAQVFLADSANGPIVAKVYPEERTRIAHRCAAAQSVFEKGGLSVPELVWRETDKRGPGQLACLVFRFVAGDHYRPGDRKRLALGCANLAKIHAIPAEAFDDPHPHAIPPRALDHDWPLGERKPNDRDPAESLQELFERALGPFGRIDVARFADWTAVCAEAVDLKPLPAVMLHGDYQKNNVIFDADQTPFTIDLDNVRTGKFCRELGVSLMRWRYGRTVNIPYADLGSLGNDDVLKAAEQAYFSAALPESADFWREHRETFFLAAYSRSIRILLERVCDTNRFGPLKRLRLSRSARVGWRRLNAHLKNTYADRQFAVPAGVPEIHSAEIPAHRRN